MKLLIVLALAVASVSAASLNTIPKFGFSEGRIINGQDAAKGEAPYMVSLQFLLQHFCGGSILSPHWVVTAAHCLGIYYLIFVVVGINQLSDSPLAQTRMVTKQIRHESYEGNIGPYDIGLCYIKDSLDLNTWVDIVSLPINPLDDIGVGKLYGFGYDSSNQLSNKLQFLDVTVIDYDDCKNYWPSPPLAESNVCTRNAGTRDSACSGDSGGPLVRQIDGVTTLVGIVSWGRNPCGEDSYPSVYTRVSAHRAWLQAQVGIFAAEEF